MVMALQRQIEFLPEVLSEAVAWRRHLHKHPELAFQERNTADFIASKLAQFGLVVHGGLSGTGVVGTLSRGTSRQAIAIRADMDALSMEEKTGVPHSSATKGVMHACGHDGHVAMALTAARFCTQLPNLDGTVHFIFQPAEENEGGAERMVNDGLFRQFPCQSVYALHNWPDLPLGTCIARDGAMMAAFAVFEIEVTGTGCHSAMPHQGTDVLLAASHIVSAVQSIVSRNVDPTKCGVVSVTQIHGGSAWNVIPDTCVLRGSVRCLDDEVSHLIERKLGEIARMTGASFGCKAEMRFDRRSPATINDPTAASLIRSIAAAPPLNLDVVDGSPSMASEDFAFMLQEVPGCYFWLGSGQSGQQALHSPNYDFNDALLPIGASLWVQLVRSCFIAS